MFPSRFLCLPVRYWSYFNTKYRVVLTWDEANDELRKESIADDNQRRYHPEVCRIHKEGTEIFAWFQIVGGKHLKADPDRTGKDQLKRLRPKYRVTRDILYKC